MEYILEVLDSDPDTVLSLTSVTLNSQGIPLVQLYLGDALEVLELIIHQHEEDKLGVAAVITDVPWGQESKTLYNTKVDWRQFAGKMHDLCFVNDKLPEERRYADLGKVDGETIICAMGDTEALRDLEAGWKVLKLPVGPVPPLCVSGGFVVGMK